MKTVYAVIFLNLVAVALCAALEENVAEIQGVSSQLNPFLGPIEQPSYIEKRFPQHLDPTLLKFWIHVGECPESSDGVKKYFCPSMTPAGKQVCIDDYQLCNGMKECPNAEDENKHYCLFYNALKSQVQLLERSLATLNNMYTKSPVRRYAHSYQGYDYK